MKKTDVKRLGNNEGVTLIVMHPTACVKCQLGQDWYKCEFEVDFMPNGCYPDYMEVGRFVEEEIDGKELNIEHAAKVLYDFLKETYEPSSLRVCNHIRGCKTHFDVDVYAEE